MGAPASFAWKLLPCVTVFITAVNATYTPFVSQAAGNISPIVVPPSGHWDGYKGRWSSFEVRMGTPAQRIRVLASTSSATTWTALQHENSVSGSNKGVPSSGEVFGPDDSTSWTPITSYESNILTRDTCVVGTDNLGIGIAGSATGQTLGAQTIVACDNVPLGMLGLGLSSATRSIGSNSSTLLENLRSRNIIPSISYSYGVGASYRNASGQLILGGFDESRFERNGLSFHLDRNPPQNMAIGLRSIVANQGTSTADLLPSAILAKIDSSVTDMWLPESACSLFESTLGLTYDIQSDTYLIEDAVHTQLLEKQPLVTFTIGARIAGEETVSVTLPYAAFDLTEPSSHFGSGRRFPLKRAHDETAATLGRVFLQEAYLIVDQERRNFSISRARFDFPDFSEHVVPITPDAVTPMVHSPIRPMPSKASAHLSHPSQTLSILPSMVSTTMPFSSVTAAPVILDTDRHSHPPSKGVIAGIVIGPTGAVAAVLLLAVCMKRRVQSATRRLTQSLHRHSSSSTLTPMGDNLPVNYPSPKSSTTGLTISGPELVNASSGFTPANPTTGLASYIISSGRISRNEKENLASVRRMTMSEPAAPVEQHPLFRASSTSPLLPPCASPRFPFARNDQTGAPSREREPDKLKSNSSLSIMESSSSPVHDSFPQLGQPAPAHFEASTLSCVGEQEIPLRSMLTNSSEYWDRFFLPVYEQEPCSRGQKVSTAEIP